MLKPLIKKVAVVPSTPLSASILSDGVTLRAVMSKGVTGSATDGLVWSEDSITSGVLTDDVYLDLTIPLVLADADDSDFTLDYSAASGSLTSDGGDLLSFSIPVSNGSEQEE